MATPSIVILVVDDDSNLLRLLIDTLTAIGYRATGAENGERALELLAKRHFDLTITDIKMPGIDGIELLHLIRKSYPRMPVLFITGVATPEIMGAANPDGFLAKPFRISRIEELIERTLNRIQPGHRVMHKVLVVTGNEISRTAIIDGLRLSQYVTIGASSIAEALRQLRNGTFDAIITDLSLSDAQRASIAQVVADQCPDTPIIFLTDEPVEGLMRTHGNAHVIRKPVEADILLPLLDHLTSQIPLRGR